MPVDVLEPCRHERGCERKWPGYRNLEMAIPEVRAMQTDQVSFTAFHCRTRTFIGDISEDSASLTDLFKVDALMRTCVYSKRPLQCCAQPGW